MNKVILDGLSLTLQDVADVARKGYKVELDPKAVERVKASRKIVDKFVDEGKVYMELQQVLASFLTL